MMGIIAVVAIKKIICKSIRSKLETRSRINGLNCIGFHAVKLYVDTFPIVEFWVENNSLNRDRKVKIENVEGCVKYIALKDTIKLLPHHKIYNLIVCILLDSYLRPVSQLKRFLPREL
jgi:hypothetical protein